MPTPELYWHGTDLDAAPWADLPDSYVTRPNVGYSTHGIQVMVGGREALARKRRSPDGVRRHMADYLARHAYEHLVYLLEATMQDEDAAVTRPRSYRAHVYAGHVAVVQVNSYRLRWQRWRRRWKTCANLYTPDWRPLDVTLAPARPRGPLITAPRCLDAMLDAAARLGREYGSYVAIDFYATPDGPRLGEITPTPRRGAGSTAEADALLGAPWHEHCPDAL